jgi:hypothetical protein
MMSNTMGHCMEIMRSPAQCRTNCMVAVLGAQINHAGGLNEKVASRVPENTPGVE